MPPPDPARSGHRDQLQYPLDGPVLKDDHHALRRPFLPWELEHDVELAEPVRVLVDPFHVVEVAHPQLLADGGLQLGLGQAVEAGPPKLSQLGGLEVLVEFVVAYGDRELSERRDLL